MFVIILPFDFEKDTIIDNFGDKKKKLWCVEWIKHVGWNFFQNNKCIELIKHEGGDQSYSKIHFTHVILWKNCHC